MKEGSKKISKIWNMFLCKAKSVILGKHSNELTTTNVHCILGHMLCFTYRKPSREDPKIEDSANIFIF